MESGLVLIPLMGLFLISVGLVIAVNFRNIDKAFVQGRASAGALGSSFDAGLHAGDEIVTLNYPGAGGDLRVLVTREGRNLPNLLSAFTSLSQFSDRRTSVTGIAVMESDK